MRIGRKQKLGHWSKNDTALTIMALPTTVWYILFAYLPMFGVIIAFKNFRIQPGRGFFSNLLTSEWAGFKNFEFIIRSNSLGIILRNTILYNVVFIILGAVITVGLAILISHMRNKKGSKIYQTMMCFPHFMSWVVVSYFLMAFLNQDNGLFNTMLRQSGREPIAWYLTASVWPMILVIMNIWKGTGYGMIIYLSSIAGIDGTMYEAAMIDGATKLQQVRYITLPSLKPVIVMMFILSIGRIFYTDFGLFYQLSGGASGSIFNTTATLDTFVFNSLRAGSPLGMTAAVTVAQSIACMLTILGANQIVKWVDRDSAII